QPSSEIAMHLFTYQQRPDIGACIHAHPPYATAFAVAGVKLESDILPEVVVFVGDIPLTAYAPPGTEAVPKALAPYIEKNSAFLLSNHGLLTIGRTLAEAYNRHETVEQYARIIHLARQLSPDIRHIPSADYERLVALRRQLAANKLEDD
ncbi:MAG: class II aldolase/adducin family protein, partial [candidate division Zixibacteria bacterium]|nr:class II aldolase/adducin family protein [candidate division Zixibacteria bacterium]